MPLLLISFGCGRQSEPAEEATPAREVEQPPQPAAVVHRGELAPNSTLQQILLDLGLEYRQIHQLIVDTREVYNLNRVRAGRSYQAVVANDGSLAEFRYDIDNEKYFEARLAEDGFSSRIARKGFVMVTETVSGVIESSLWQAVLDQGEGEGLVARLAELMRWDIDFTSTHRDDWFRVIVEKKFRNNELLGYGRILAIQFNSGGKDFFGFHFHPPGAEKPGYYDEKGQSLKKAFLKVPFNFNPRISSGFSYSRFHPILKKRRPHPALDFAAPKGTPVLASAAGTVIFAGRRGGFGNFVQIRHPNRYTTSYAHLSRIHVKRGQRVKQAQMIGRVGSTGLATGAHLDYRIQDQRGRYLNPKKRIAWPADKAVDKRYWSEFTTVRETFLGRLQAIPIAESPPKSLASAD